MPFMAAAAFLGSAAFGTTAGVATATIVTDIAIGATLAGVGMQMKGAKMAAKSEAAVYKYNAQVAEREARMQRRASMEEQQVQRDQMRRTLKRNRALYAKGKVMMTGSPLEVQLQTVEVMAADIATLATERQFGAGRFRARAGLERFRARDVERAGRLAVGTALVGGVSDVSKLGISYYLNR